MSKRDRLFVALAILLVPLWLSGEQVEVPHVWAQSSQESKLYLPLVFSPAAPLLHAPLFNGEVAFPETAIFWFGHVSSTENYADLRVGYTSSELYINVTAFDRRLWYDTAPTAADLSQWDGATIYLEASDAPGATPGPNSYRFDAQINWWEQDRAAFQASYRGNGTSWNSTALAFSTVSGWRGNGFNEGGDDRGWALTFHIPFTSLGRAAAPAQGSTWRLGVAMHDRDDGAAALADTLWPALANSVRPNSWARLSFGLPVYSPPAATTTQTITIRQGLNGATVADGAVGGGSVCGAGLDFWTQWGQANYAARADFNIQNQSDVADWPCFSKYYVTFPLNALPSGHAVVSAKLTLRQMGGSDPTQAQRSLIQVLTVAESWNEATLAWNNAPAPIENVARAWVDPFRFPSDNDWNKTPIREWDVSAAVAAAYAAGTPLNLALYSADSEQHSGKYFVSSNIEEWGAVYRPTLTVVLSGS